MAENELGLSKDKPVRPIISNVLAERYASTPVVVLFSSDNKVLIERELWITIMEGQASLGLNIPQAAIDSYRETKSIIDHSSMRRRELKLKHDEKARLEEFNALAGYEFAHLGLTSRDQSDNVEQLQNRLGMEVIRDRAVATLSRLASLAVQYSDLTYAERTHFAVAQPSLIGKIFANAGEDLLIGFNRLETLIEEYPLRGIKGAVGTQTDQLQLFGGDQEKVDKLESIVAKSLGFTHILGSVGQVYPRSLDFEVVSRLYQLISPLGSLAMTMRLMAGNEEFTEGFKPGQVGSTAMPHKMNSRSAERVKGLKNDLTGYLTMAVNVSGEQWYGGDVSDSSTRRVFLPDSFFATDGIFQTMLTVLDQGGFYPAVIAREVERYLPFLTTTRLLMAATSHGVGREVAHSVIRDHSVAVALRMRQEGIQENDLLDRLTQDPRFPVPKEKLVEAISNSREFVGSAPRQIENFVRQVEPIITKYSKAATYIPEEIL